MESVEGVVHWELSEVVVVVVELEVELEAESEVGKGTVVFPPLVDAIPPVAPVALISDSALASLVQDTIVPRSLTEGRAKHDWLEEQLVVFHASATHCASSPEIHAVCPEVHASVDVRVWNSAFNACASCPF